MLLLLHSESAPDGDGGGVTESDVVVDVDDDLHDVAVDE
jgi:hypothetical protein